MTGGWWGVGTRKTKSLLPPDHKSGVSWEDSIRGSPDWRSGPPHCIALYNKLDSTPQQSTVQYNTNLCIAHNLDALNLPSLKDVPYVALSKEYNAHAQNCMNDGDIT